MPDIRDADMVTANGNWSNDVMIASVRAMWSDFGCSTLLLWRRVRVHSPQQAPRTTQLSMPPNSQGYHLFSLEVCIIDWGYLTIDTIVRNSFDRHVGIYHTTVRAGRHLRGHQQSP